MGGKTKQSQRTKNNVRPSSSARSAELLNNPVKMDSGLVVAGGKALPALFPTLAATPLDAGLNTEFSLCLKKLNKKDPITKTKALQELTELVGNSKLDDVAAVLPGWTHFYKILAVDTDRKVREAAQVCHEALVRVCGRRVAPHLKQLLPAWLQAQHDEHAPAQARAQASLASTFPESKLPEVISFCRVEVTSYLIDNLTGAVETAVNKKTENAEERLQLYSRQMSASLNGLEYFVQHLPAAHGPWLWEQLEPLLQANSFWKLAGHAEPSLRSSWYAAVGRIIERFGSEFGSKCGSRAMRLLLNAREPHGLVAVQLWACLLQLMHSSQDWHKWVDKKELLIKRILDILENGGWGEARRLSDVLLPLLARLPADMLTLQFYESFFDAAFTGLQKKSVLSSKCERQAWITSISECLRYVSIQREPFVPNLVSRVHRDWLEITLKPRDEPLAGHIVRYSASNMAALLKYWLKRSRDDEIYDHFVRSFWQNVTSTLLGSVDKASSDTEEILRLMDGQILLLQTLKTSLLQDAKKQRSIKFEGDTETSPQQTQATPTTDPHIVSRYNHNLQEAVERVSARYLQLARQDKVPDVLSALLSLLVEFDSVELYRSIARQMEIENPYLLYELILRPWLIEHSMRCRAVVDLVFQLMTHLTEHEQDLVFNSFEKMTPEVIEWCISVSVSHPHCGRAAPRRWLRGPSVRTALVAACRRMLAAGDCGHTNLLITCLAQDNQGDVLVSNETVQGIVSECSAALQERVRDVTQDGLEEVARLAATLATCLAPHAANTLPALVAALFQLNLLVPLGSPHLSPDTWREVVASWQDGVAALSPQQREAFLDEAVTVIHEQLCDDMDNLNITKIDNITTLCPYLLSQSDSPQPALDEMLALTQRMLAEQPSTVETFALRHDCVVSKLNCPFNDDCDAIKQIVDESAATVNELTKEILMPYVYRVLFRAMYLRTMLLRRPGVEEEEEDEEEGKNKGGKEQCWCDALLADKSIVKEFCKVLYDYAVVCSLHESYAYWPHYDIIQRTKRKLDSLLEDVSHDTSAQSRHAILEALSTLAASKGYYWSLARQLYLGEGKKVEGEQGEEMVDEVDLEKLREIVTGSGFFHSLQVDPDPSASLRSLYYVMVRSLHVAHSHEPDVVDKSFAYQTTSGADFIVNLYYTHNHVMLYERDISKASWQQVVSNTAVCEYLRAQVLSHGWDMPAHHWDFTTITLCSLLTSVEKSKHCWGSTKVSMLIRAVLRLYDSVEQFVSSVTSQCLQRQPSDHVAALPTEWKDIFAPDIHLNLFSLLLHILESSEKTMVTSNHVRVISGLQQTMRQMSWTWLPQQQQQSVYSLQHLSELCAKTLSITTHHGFKYLAHQLLLMIVKPIVLEDAEKLAQWSNSGTESEEDRQRPQFALSYFSPALEELHSSLEDTFAHLLPGEDVCELTPHTETHSAALGCLLLSDALFAVCQLQRNDLTQHYIEMFRNAKFAEQQLTIALRLLPEEVAAYAQDSGNSSPSPAHNNMWLQTKELSVDEPSLSSDVSALACRVLYASVSGPGAARARGWWGCASPRAARGLERTVRAYVTPALVKAQLQLLHERRNELEDTEITIHWSTQEAVCVYQVEERSLTLSVTLARSHPLVPPRVATPPGQPQAPAPNTSWIALYLAYQNGTLLNALKMWCSAVNARVEAAPQCYICYCRLHPSSGRLPQVLCHQCKNKFHSQCLRKWFTSSNKSNCPLCRSSF